MFTLNSSWHYLCGALAAKLGKNPIYHPLITTFEITYRCNLRCGYCSDGSGVRCPDLAGSELSTAEIAELFRIIRPVNDIVGITGGEPLVRDDIVDVLRAAKARGLKIVLNTNAVLVHEKPEVLDYVDELITSLESLDTRKLASLWQCPEAVADRTIENIARMARLQRQKKFMVAIQSLINEETLEDIRDVMAFCRDRGIAFSPSPEVRGIALDTRLLRSKEFKDLMRYIRERKTGGDRVLTTFGFLDTVTEERGFRCMPMVNPRINPMGDLYYPCIALKRIAGNLLEEKDYMKVIRNGFKKFGPPPECKDRCQFNCIIDFSEIVQKPTLILRELYLAVKGAWKNVFRNGRSAS